jgi:hypothetical protein
VVGKPSDSEVAGGQTAYAQIDQQAPLYVIKTDFLAHMPKTLADFTATN